VRISREAELEAERDTAIHMRDIEERNKIDHLNTLEKVEAERDALKARNEEIYKDNLEVSKWKSERIRELEALCREYIDALDSGYDVLASHATDKIREAVK
jgi:hypothetical protein